MGDSYVEILVKKEPKPWYGLVKGAFIFVTLLVLVFLGILQMSIVFIILGALLGVASYFVFQELDLEYEYLYVNGTLTVDKIMGKAARKKCVEVTFDQVELVAPVKSWRAGELNGRKAVVLDYTSGTQSEQTYAMFFRGAKGFTKLLFEPNDKMLEAMRFTAPSKVTRE